MNDLLKRMGLFADNNAQTEASCRPGSSSGTSPAIQWGWLEILLGEEPLQKVEQFKYLRSVAQNNGVIDANAIYSTTLWLRMLGSQEQGMQGYRNGHAPVWGASGWQISRTTRRNIGYGGWTTRWSGVRKIWLGLSRARVEGRWRWRGSDARLCGFDPPWPLKLASKGTKKFPFSGCPDVIECL